MGLTKFEKFEINQIKKTCFYDDKYFSSSSILIAVTYDYDKYFGKYGNCGDKVCFNRMWCFFCKIFNYYFQKKRYTVVH